MAWADRLSDPAIRIYGYITMEGTPWVFSSQTLPTGWVASPYSEVVALDLPAPAEIPQSPLERKAGVAQPGNVTLTLGPRLFSQLSRLLCPIAPTRTRLTDDLLYSLAVPYNGRIYCDTSALGISGTGILYVGHEAISYSSVAAGHAVISNREQLGSVEGQWRIAEGTPWVSTQPQGLVGRHVTLTLGLADAAGVPIDAALGGDNQWEAWRGTIDEVDHGDDHRTWILRTVGLEADLDKEIAGRLTDRTGHLHIAASAEGTVSPTPTPYSAYSGLWLSPSLKYIRCAVADSGTGGVLTDVTLNLGAAQYIDDIMGHIHNTLKAALAVFTAAGGAAWFVEIDETSTAGGADQQADDAPALLDKRHTIRVSGVGAGTIDFRWYSAGAAGEQSASASGNIMTVMGFTSEDLTTPKESTSGAASWLWSATNFPLAYYLPPDATEIEAQWEGDVSPPTADGYVMIPQTGELFQYGSWSYLFTGTGPANGLVTFSDCTRGALGTTPQAVAVDWETSTATVWGSKTVVTGLGEWEGEYWGQATFGQVGTWVDKSAVSVTATPTILLVAGFDGLSLVEILLSLVSATGTAGTRGTYDLAGIPEDCGAAQSLDGWDTARMLATEAELPAAVTTRYLMASKVTSVREWASQELLALGMVLQARLLSDRTYRLTLDRISDPVAAVAITLTTDDLSATEPVKIAEYGSGAIINRLRARALWSVTEEDWIGPEWLFEDRQSQQEHGPEPAMELRMRGLSLSVAAAQGTLTGLVMGLLSHWSRPYRVVTLAAKRSAWTLRPGTCIGLTHADLPATSGGYGWTQEPLVVLASEPCYLSDGLRASARVTCLQLPDRNCTYYAPSGLVSSYAAGTPSITLYANEFSDPSLPYPLDPAEASSDILWFVKAIGSSIQIHNEGDDANGETATVVDVKTTTRTIKLSGALTLVPGARCIVTWPTYASANAYQERFAYLADASYTLGAGGDSAQQYGG